MRPPVFPGMPARSVKLHHHLLSAVIDTLRAVFIEGAHAPRAVEEALKSHHKWGSRDRRLFAESVYELVRWRRKYAWLAGVPDGLAEPMTEDHIRRLWLAWWAERGHEAPDFAEFTYPPAPAAASPPPAVAASLPDWLYETGAAELGAAWPALVDALNETAPVYLRANTIKVTSAKLVHTLAGEGIEATRDPARPDTFRLTARRGLASSPAFRAGLFEVQDAGSQEIAPMVLAEPGMLVVDGCAGAGGKSLHLACLMQNQGRIIAMDVAAKKLEELRRRVDRNGASIIRTEEITAPEVLSRRAGTADRLLLDVPCSGLGVLRRNPDTKWKLTAAELDRLRALQREILENSAPVVKPGGALVYATCSVLPSENQDQVRAFLTAHPDDWKLEEERTISPLDGPHDGFYAARLRRL